MSGCGMDYINDATNLFNFAKRCNDINIFLELVYQISLTLREIHSDPRKIVVGNLSFNNIIFDRNMKHHFVDFDSCKIDKMPADMIPSLLDSYTKVRDIYRYDIDANTDRLCLILCTLYTIFCKNIDRMTLYEFDSKTEGITALRNMRGIIIQIKKQARFLVLHI